MDESLFLMALFCGFLLFAALIWCFLSTCLGLEIRRSDILEAFTPAAFSARERDRRARMARGEYLELDDMRPAPGLGGGYDRLSGGRVGDEIEFMRRGGPGGRFY